MPRWWTFLLMVLGCAGGMSQECLEDITQAYRAARAICRLTYPAAVVLNEKTTKVIEAAFQHAKYPSVTGEKALLFGSKVVYGLDNLEIFNLTIGRSAFELLPGKGISLDISNVSAVFKGTIKYAYGGWMVNLENSVDFEVESQIDLGINPKLYCGRGRVIADTSDCYLKFHKLQLLLQGDREPNWLKKLFTNFITFTVKLVVRAQICQEINKVANILADFIQDTAENFLTVGDISVDIGVTGTPTITANYIESYHKGLTKYKNTTSVVDEPFITFQPAQLTEHKMLYFWLSDQMMNLILSAAHEDGRFQLNVSGTELTELFNTNPPGDLPEEIQKCLMEPGSVELRVWSSAAPYLNTSRDFGTTVWTEVLGQLLCGGSASLNISFNTAVAVEIWASYANKTVSLRNNPTEVSAYLPEIPIEYYMTEKLTKLETFIVNAVKKTGVPKVISVLETEITRLLNKQGVDLFDIYSPEVIPRDNYVIIQMDFGFPHHLLVEFLRKTLE